MTDASSKALREEQECRALASCIEEALYIAITRALQREEKLTAEIERLREAATALVNAVMDEHHLRNCDHSSLVVDYVTDLRAALAGEMSTREKLEELTRLTEEFGGYAEFTNPQEVKL